MLISPVQRSDEPKAAEECSLPPKITPDMVGIATVHVLKNKYSAIIIIREKIMYKYNHEKFIIICLKLKKDINVIISS